MRVEILMGFIFFRSYLLRLKKFRHFIIIFGILNETESAISCVVMVKTQISVLLCHLQTVEGSARLPDEDLKRSRLHCVGFFF